MMNHFFHVFMGRMVRLLLLISRNTIAVAGHQAVTSKK